jgi:hypothetical protein
LEKAQAAADGDDPTPRLESEEELMLVEQLAA